MDPPLTGVAVKVQPLPRQPGLLPLVREILTDGAIEVVTFVVMTLELTGDRLPDRPKIILGLLTLVVAPELVEQMVVVAPSNCRYAVAVNPGLERKFWYAPLPTTSFEKQISTTILEVPFQTNGVVKLCVFQLLNMGV